MPENVQQTENPQSSMMIVVILLVVVIIGLFYFMSGRNTADAPSSPTTIIQEQPEQPAQDNDGPAIEVPEEIQVDVNQQGGEE